ncbi:transglycosylase domain-containing protein [Alicyclobacillus ferrooxydans]|uniref:transglycosylase domain-containing protein n=1 Tax=Alicyclobacillus ferrooxydans TaxID=471514 RepID=UPI0009FB11D6|nr:transglycosylase domain-containing protein [Alicyclobacillus ferrooxydans]
MKFWMKAAIFSAVTVPLVTVSCAFALVTYLKRTPIDLTKLTSPPEQTVVYDQARHVYMKIGTPPSNMTYSQIPTDLINAVVATEDHTYWTGSSIDIRSIFRALYVDLRNRQASQGASTIQEQLAKIVYLNDNKTLSYKLQEIAMGVQLSRYFTKQQILSMYLDKVFLGENAVGVREAALRYFGVDIERNPNALTLPEAALIAGLPQAPTGYDPLLHPHAALQRRNQVLQNMATYGYITQAQAAAAEKTPLGVKYHSISQDGWNTHPLFTNVLFDYAAKAGITPQQLLQGGLKIYTTIDPQVQKAVHTVFWSTNYNGDFPGPTQGTVVEGAAVFVNPQTGGILGAAGSRKQGYTRLGIDRIFSNSSPGSSIKPIMEYAPAIQSGNWTPTSILNNQPQNFGGGYTPANWEGPNGPKKVTLQYALEESQNIASVWLLQQIGLQTGTAFAMNDGIQLTATDREHLGVAIGGMQYGVNAVEMAQAYEPFDNQGVQVQVHLITQITNQDGQTVYRPKLTTKTIMSPSTATTLTRLMQDVVAYGTGTSAQVPGWAVAGKTGTVQYSSGLTGYYNWVRNAWFDGYTPNMVGSIYLGYDNSSPQHHLTMAPLDPSANAARIFGDITRLAEAGRSPEQFSAGPFPASLGTANAAYALQTPVSGLHASWNAQAKGVNLTWSAKIPGASSYAVTRAMTGGVGSSSSSGSAVEIATTSKPAYLDQSVTPGGTYQYSVQALSSNGTPLGSPQTITFTVPGGLSGSGSSTGNNLGAGSSQNTTGTQNQTGTTNTTGSSNSTGSSGSSGSNGTSGSSGGSSGSGGGSSGSTGSQTGSGSGTQNSTGNSTGSTNPTGNSTGNSNSTGGTVGNSSNSTS